jgi:hypothetical protein
MINNLVDFEYMKILEANVEFFNQSNIELRYFSKTNFQNNFSEIINRHNFISQVSQHLIKPVSSIVNHSTCSNNIFPEFLNINTQNLCFFPQNIQNNIQVVNTIQNINIHNNYTNNIEFRKASINSNLVRENLYDSNEKIREKKIKRKRRRSYNKYVEKSKLTLDLKELKKKTKTRRQFKQNGKMKIHRDITNIVKNEKTTIIHNKLNFSDSECRLVNFINMPIKRKRIKKIECKNEENHFILIPKEEISKYLDYDKLKRQIEVPGNIHLQFMKKNFQNFEQYQEIINWRKDIKELVVDLKFRQPDIFKSSHLTIKKLWETDKLECALSMKYYLIN